MDAQEQFKGSRLFSIRLTGLIGSHEFENGSLSLIIDKIKFINRKSYQLKKAIRTTSLLKEFDIFVQFNDGEAWIEVTVPVLTGEFPDFKKRLEEIRKELHSCFVFHRKNNLACSSATGDQTSPMRNPGRGEAKAFSKLFSGPVGICFEVDLSETGQVLIKATQDHYTGSLVIDRTVVKIATGQVDRFTEASQKVVLHDLDKFRGSLIIEVNDFEMRNKLISAQLEGRRVTISYHPFVDPLCPEIPTNIGRLRTIISAGPSQNCLLLAQETELQI